MGSRSGREREIVISSHTPLIRHSLNQDNIGYSLDGERRLRIKSRAQHKAERKEGLKSQTQKASELPFSLDLFNQSVESLRRGEATVFEVAYVGNNLPNLESGLLGEEDSAA